jgi:predicted nucleic acid-binding Zn ribbon protein
MSYDEYQYGSHSLRLAGERCSEAIAEQKKQRYRNRKEYSMPLLQVVLVLVVVGVVLWLVDRFIPMASSIKSILNAVVTIAVVIWLLNVFGLMHYLTNIHIGKS